MSTQNIEWAPDWMTAGTRAKVEALVTKGDTGPAALFVLRAHKEAQMSRTLTLQGAGQIVAAAKAALQNARNKAKGRW